DFAANIAYRGEASSENGRLVSADYFRVLQLKPAAGRLLTREDDRAGANNLAVLSHRYWLTRFQADPSAVNDSVIINGQSMVVIGVTPSGYSGTTLEDDPKVYVPLSMAALMIPGWNGFDNRRDHWLYLFARLKP